MGKINLLSSQIDDKRFQKINLINLSFYQIERGNMIFIIPLREIDFRHLVPADAELTIS